MCHNRWLGDAKRKARIIMYYEQERQGAKCCVAKADIGYYIYMGEAKWDEVNRIAYIPAWCVC